MRIAISSLVFWLLPLYGLVGQCPMRLQPSGSDYLKASYEIAARLDDDSKTLSAHQTIHWHNTSPDTIRDIRLYLYMNAFSGMSSSFIARQDGEVFGQRLDGYRADDWGHISITSLQDEDGVEVSGSKTFIRDLDGNLMDSTIVQYTLSQPILPGATRDLELDFTVKMPRLIARSGYSLGSYYLFVHWFPQMCVYQEQEGRWQWNSHQFVPSTEFYADFGNYRVSLDVPKGMVIGATGCQTHHLETADRQVLTYSAASVIDFAWVAYPRFEVYRDQWKDIELELLLPPEHAGQAKRMLTAAKQALTYLDDHVGPYAYSRLTIVGPPLHALRSGLMEYPMLITCGTAFGLPQRIRTIESLVVHELTHQYFMAVLANNEKEEAWMDESFVTYYEDRIIDHYYGTSSLFDLPFYSMSNAAKSRKEYLDMDNLMEGSIGRPGWEFKAKNYKPLIYAKGATLLRTIESIIGREAMDAMMRSYYEQYQFSHPTGANFIQHVRDFVNHQALPYRGDYIASIVADGIYDASYYDAAVSHVQTDGQRHIASIKNIGSLDLPVTVEWQFQDGYTKRQNIHLSELQELDIRHPSKLCAVIVDPDRERALDSNWLNNSWHAKDGDVTVWSTTSRTTSWLQSFFHLVSTAL